MSRSVWHVQRDAEALTVSRRLPARFDVVGETSFPNVGQNIGRARLAHQIRQDVWRAFRHVRGFSPVVQVFLQNEGILIRAGGEVLGAKPSQTLLEILAGVLECSSNRARWLNFARFKNASRPGRIT